MRSTRVHSTFYCLAWFILASLFTLAAAPAIETYATPVYSKFTLVSAEQHPRGVLAVFDFVKNRHCDPMGLSWYLGEVGASTSINAAAPEGVRSPRPVGENRSSPYLMEGITVDDLQTRVIAVLRNQCYFMGFKLPWISVSNVYP